ncbi:MAG: CBS domain-containing protein [Candidatus Margulisiibacteriota bacterium]
MVLFSEMFVSDLIGDPVVDRVQEPVGRVKDIIITLGETFPKVTGLLIKREDNKKEAVLLLAEVDLIGPQFVATKSIKSRIIFTELREGEVLLERDIFDKQIVDVDGARVIRVNDLKLAKVEQEVRLIAADTGLTGLLRRLGMLRLVNWVLKFFGRQAPETLIGWDHVESLKTDFNKGYIAIPHKRTAELHPADIAHIISQVNPDQRKELFTSLSEKTAAESLHELEPMIGAMLLQTIDTKKALGILEKMPVDEVADLLGDLPPERTEEFLRLIRIKKSAEIRKLLKHHDETAGGLMTTEFITLPRSLTVEETINRLRETAPSAETIYYLYVVDETERLVGVLSLRNLIISLPEKRLEEVMIRDCITVTVEMNQRQVAEVISKYNLLAVPVVDGEGRVQGIVTVDDVIDLILPPVSRRKRQMLG